MRSVSRDVGRRPAQNDRGGDRDGEHGDDPQPPEAVLGHDADDLGRGDAATTIVDREDDDEPAQRDFTTTERHDAGGREREQEDRHGRSGASPRVRPRTDSRRAARAASPDRA